ncbi:nickel pincer cofactor biosynthesis protein LarC [Lederbergia lenta]|nr:nickel pincer cofactor biosynthesis protein LarC [Lederbergia lenta]MCM3112327.1 nickel pincer cofactor biosynthesis protein LarC [Lederbergia lenta]MEC2326547.1 nickel pincer cofactor biosynthesis protein LarC [Lederbergia lenta]
MKVLYIDCFSGISGDMMVGALIHAGASPERIERELKKLNVSGYHLDWKKAMKEGISAMKFDVILTNEHSHKNTSHSATHEHSHSHADGHSHEHDSHEHNHIHAHDHDHHHHAHKGHTHHPHSHYADIIKLIDDSELDHGVKERSKQIFAPIAKSEAKIHDMAIEDVHFHEVGAVDSIVDIVATAIGLEELEIEKVVTSHVPLGSGHIHIDHGVYPVPAPATLDMLKNVPIAPSNLPFELTTPTGAGIVVSQTDSFGTMPAMKVTSIGYGAGTKNIPGRPNVLRVMVGELLQGNEYSTGHAETVTVLECQLDDMTGEAFGYVMDKLLDEGALDVYYTPVYMKKNRPGTLVTVLAPNDREARLSDVLFQETTTLGVRKNTWSRSILDREIVTVDTPYGPIKMKQALKKGKLLRQVPEYEDVKKAAQLFDTTFQEVYQTALRAGSN